MLLPCLICSSALLHGEQNAAVPVREVALPAGTPLFIRGNARVRSRDGQAVRGHLLFDVYAGSALVLPMGTEIDGQVMSLKPDHARRVGSSGGVISS